MSSKDGGTHKKQLLDINKQIWKYLLANHIMITVEYPLSKLNVKADWESRHTESSSEWKHLPEVFHVIGKNVGQQQ